jgi:TolB protein
MLTRTLRLTDKLTHALLRLLTFGAELLLEGLAQLRGNLTALFTGIVFGVLSIFQRGRTFTQTGGVAVGERVGERRRASMARRAENIESVSMRVREDPLRTQNRALSLFTVLLLGVLIVLVLWFTSNPNINNSAAVRPTSQLPTPLPSASPNAGGLPLPPTSRPTETPIPDPLRTGGSIVFVQRERGYDNLWAAQISQPTPIRLTNGPADDRDPAWSPDGTKIAFASKRRGNWDLYVMDVATLRVTQLTVTPGYERKPVWSPDGAFIAYEAYENNNLDIWIVGSGGRPEPLRLTENPAPDFAPTWSPGLGREIAFISLRDGNAEIYISNLDRPGNPRDATAIRFTNTPDLDEDWPAWSPDNQWIAYSARDTRGLQLVYLKRNGQPTSDPTALGPGREPGWSPDAASVIVALDATSGTTTTLLSYQVGTVGVAATTISVRTRAFSPNWTKATLPASLKNTPPPAEALAPVLYTEEIGYKSEQAPTRRLRDLSGGKPPPHSLFLTDSVDDSYAMLREAAKARIGLDFLGDRVEMLWKISGSDRYIPDPGLPIQNWHYAGRAFDFDRNLVYTSNPDVLPPVEVVREDDPNGQTFWRVYVRVPESLQNGTLGEPLKRLPWDFASRTSVDPQVVESGGKTKATVPPGYYVDFTALAEDFGWQRVPALRNWRGYAGGILYWQFERRDGLQWVDAMQELYTLSVIDSFLSGPPPRPTPIPTETRPAPVRTATPIPPDQQP